MKKLVIAAVLCLILVLSTSCVASTTWQTITAEQAHAIMAETYDFVLLDVRTQAEFRQARIDGAQLLPYDEINSRAGELPGHDAIILIYCRSGRRSAIAAQVLAELGFTNIHDFGGINDWPFDIIEGEN